MKLLQTMLKLVLVTSCFLSISPEAAHADAGVPMLGLMWPLFFVCFIPIIIIEAFVLKKWLPKLPTKKRYQATIISNLVSTLLGIPLTWIALVIVELLTPGGPSGFVDVSFPWRSILLVTIGAPWLPPYGAALYLMIPASVLFLLIPFFFISAWCEALVTRKVLKGQDPALVAKATWRANMASYAFLYILVIICAVVTITPHFVRG